MNRDRLPVDRRTREQSSFLKKRHTERPKKLEAGFFLFFFFFFFSVILIREKCGLWIAYIQPSTFNGFEMRSFEFASSCRKKAEESGRASEQTSERASERDRERETRLRENETLLKFSTIKLSLG